MAAPQLRFKEFDGEWNNFELGTLGYFINGLTYAPENIVEKGLLVLRSSNVQNGELAFEDNVFVDLNVAQEKLTQKNDILICVRNGSKSLIGKNALIKDLPCSATHGAFMTVFRSGLGEFVYQLLQTKRYYEYIYADLGATINSINGNNLKKYKFYLPEKKEQTKIASFLSAVDEKISQLTQKHQLLSQYKQGMMQKLFSQQIRFKADDGSEFGEWETKCLGDTVTTMQSGLSRQLHDEDIGLVVLRSNNVIDNKVSFDDVKFWYLNDPQGADVNNYLLDDGDILVNFINSMAQIGKSAIYRKTLDRKVICTTNILRIKADQTKVTSEFLNFIFQTNEYQNYIQSITKPAVNQASFTTKEFKMMIFKIPCLEEQTKIANFLSAIDQKVDVVAQQIEQAKQWKKGLLQQMFV